MIPESAVVRAPVDDTLMRQLRRFTAEDHARAESAMGSLLSLTEPTMEAYTRTVARLASWYIPAEHRLDAWTTQLAEMGIDWPARRKSDAFLRDLSALRRPPGTLPICPVPPLRDLTDALGCLYVMEGATNGGRVLSRLVVAPLGLSSTNGGEVLACYGDDVGTKWREFGSAASAYVAREVDGDVRDRVAFAIVKSAQRTFASITNWLASSQ